MSESQRVLSASLATESVTDKSGRVLEIRKLSRRELMMGMRLWGAPSNVEMWFAMAVALASVRSIDGKPIPFPQNPQQVEALSERLGDDGTAAVEGWYSEQTVPDLGEVKSQAKN